MGPLDYPKNSVLKIKENQCLSVLTKYIAKIIMKIPSWGRFEKEEFDESVL